jgi:hypothetical protein
MELAVLTCELMVLRPIERSSRNEARKKRLRPNMRSTYR